MAISPYIKHLRQHVGTDLLLLPSVAVLPYDDAGRILLVRQSDRGTWGTIGGSVEVDEDPALAAVREAEEEAGVTVELTGIIGVVGGPRYRITYPNGDQTAYVSTIYRARIIDGTPRADQDETTDVGWFAPESLAALPDLGDFARATLHDLGIVTADAKTPDRAGPAPTVSTEGPQRQLDQQSPPHLWGELWALMVGLPGVVEGHSQVSPLSSRALFFTDLLEAGDVRRTLAPQGRLEPAHLHGIEDTSLHLVLPAERGAQLVEAGWAVPHAYGDHGTEFFVYGPRTPAEVATVLGFVRESLAYARSNVR